MNIRDNVDIKFDENDRLSGLSYIFFLYFGAATCKEQLTFDNWDQALHPFEGEKK